MTSRYLERIMKANVRDFSRDETSMHYSKGQIDLIKRIAERQYDLLRNEGTMPHEKSPARVAQRGVDGFLKEVRNQYGTPEGRSEAVRLILLTGAAILGTW